MSARLRLISGTSRTTKRLVPQRDVRKDLREQIEEGDIGVETDEEGGTRVRRTMFPKSLRVRGGAA